MFSHIRYCRFKSIEERFCKISTRKASYQLNAVSRISHCVLLPEAQTTAVEPTGKLSALIPSIVAAVPESSPEVSVPAQSVSRKSRPEVGPPGKLAKGSH